MNGSCEESIEGEEGVCVQETDGDVVEGWGPWSACVPTAQCATTGTKSKVRFICSNGSETEETKIEECTPIDDPDCISVEEPDAQTSPDAEGSGDVEGSEGSGDVEGAEGSGVEEPDAQTSPDAEGSGDVEGSEGSGDVEGSEGSGNVEGSEDSTGPGTSEDPKGAGSSALTPGLNDRAAANPDEVSFATGNPDVDLLSDRNESSGCSGSPSSAHMPWLFIFLVLLMTGRRRRHRHQK
jgi:hypothetical protein